MKNLYFSLTLIGIIAGMVAYLFVVRHKVEKHDVNDPVANMIINLRKPIKAKRIQVLSGHEFDITLEDGMRIKGTLEVLSVPESKEQVLQFLNRSSNPRIILEERSGNIWFVSIFVTTKNVLGQDVEISLTKWLEEKNLIYNGRAYHGK